MASTSFLEALLNGVIQTIIEAVPAALRDKDGAAGSPLHF